MKILRITSSEFLPPYQDRDDAFIYLLYDTLDIYFYQTQYTGFYCIVHDLPSLESPDKPVKNMLYILMNGDVYVYEDDVWRQIATIDEPQQAAYLVNAGTTFLMKSGYRYIDKQTKVLNLPYQNGTFQLSVMVDKPIKIDENTIIIYNEETGQFEIDGERYYDEFGRNPEIMKYTAVESNSIKTFIQNDHIHADLKLSAKVGNTLEIRSDGLYVSDRDYANLEQFNELVNRAQAQMTAFAAYMREMEIALEHIDITLDDETLHDKIMEVLHDYEPTIDEAINDYETVIENLITEKNNLIQYVYDTMNLYKADTIERIEAINHPWEYFIDTFETKITKVGINEFVFDTQFPMEEDCALYYKVGKVYLYTSQDIADMDFIYFENGDTIYIEDDVQITICYAKTEGDEIKAKSCSYCITKDSDT